MLHPLWKFLGWFVAIAVGAGATIWVYKKQSYKALTYEVVSMTPLAREARGFGDLKVLRGDKVIDEPFLITIRLKNAGDVHISPSDFAEPLELRPAWGADRWKDWKDFPGIIMLPDIRSVKEALGGPGHIADARVAETVPSGIRAQLIVKPEQVQMQPLLLNSGDQIVVELLISGNPSAIRVTGRVAGVKEIAQERDKTQSKKKIAMVMLLSSGAALTLLIFGLLAWSELRAPKRSVRITGLLIAMLMGMFGAGVYELLR